jgi:hypothetical protein
MYIMAHNLVVTAFLIYPFHKTVCLYMHPPDFARQLLPKNATTETNTNATIEKNYGLVIFLSTP